MVKEHKGGKAVTKRELTEMINVLFSSHPDKTFTTKDVFRELHLTTHPSKMLAVDIMEEMAWDDRLTKVSGVVYCLSKKNQVLTGTFRRKANGKNSFVPDGEQSDKPVFVAERNSMWAMTGDRVRVALMARRRQHIREAKVIEILHRATDTFAGRLYDDHSMMCVATSDSTLPGIIVPRRKLRGAKEGDKVVVKVMQWPDAEHYNMIGEVMEVLGKAGDNDAEMHAILVQYGLPYRYPKNAVDAADAISGAVDAAEIARREDFRDVFTCTIDPHDAKDFDDALSIRALDAGTWEVGVHIADVSHYVAENSVIDKEALKRATSIYLVDRTIPMLPEHLCNEVCSLRPDEDKLCFSVVLTMSDDAVVTGHRIVHTVIRSKRRYTYEEVQQTLEANGVVDGTGQPAPPPGPQGYKGENAAALVTLDRLAKKLREARFRGGAVKFDREEMCFDIDEKGHPTRCYFKRSTDANKLIEEFMLLANRTVAESVGKVKKGERVMTLPYRVHDSPDPQRLNDLREFVSRFGYNVDMEGSKRQTARSLNTLMDRCAGRAEQNLIQIVALRSMSKARYSIHNIGHFGLAFDYYTHFTSPIRRYPDLMVHRLLTRYQEGGRSANRNYYEELCRHASDMEVVASNAERDSIRYKAVEFMLDKVGETYDAHISGIQSYGIYCEIDDNHCEGLVPIHDLTDDYYDFDERNYCLVGRHSRRTYRLGDAVRIIVAGANLEKRRLDFVLAESLPAHRAIKR